MSSIRDLAPNQQAWRAAAEIALHSVARVMLIDVRHHEHLSRVIEPIRVQRISFTGVDLSEHQDVHGVDGYISGKLIYKPSPFISWVAKRLQRPGTDALCVNGTEQLAGCPGAGDRARHASTGLLRPHVGGTSPELN